MTLAKPSDFFEGPCAKRRYDEEDFEGVGTVRCRSLTELERKQWQTATLNAEGEIDLEKVPLAGPRLMVLTVVDEENNLQFTNGDAKRLAELDSAMVGKVVEWIQAHCGLNEGSADDAVGN